MTRDNLVIDNNVREIYSWNHFDEIVGQMQNRQWIFRGQADANWELKSSLYRTFEFTEIITELGRGTRKKIARNRHEKLALERFINSAQLLDAWRNNNDGALQDKATNFKQGYTASKGAIRYGD